MKALTSLLVLAVLASGCSSASIGKVVRDQSYGATLNRVFVVIPRNPGEREYNMALTRNLESEFKQRSVELAFEPEAGLESDDSVRQKLMLAFQPQAVLILKKTWTDGGNVFYYDASLYEYPERRRIWRAQLVNSAPVRELLPEGTERMAGLLAERLEQDGLLGRPTRLAPAAPPVCTNTPEFRNASPVEKKRILNACRAAATSSSTPPSVNP